MKDIKGLGDFSVMLSGIALGKTTPGVSENREETDGRVYKILRPIDMGTKAILEPDDFCNLPELLLTDVQQKKIKPHHLLRENDIVITIRGTIFRASIIKDLHNSPNTIVSNNMMIIRPKVTYPEFIVMYLNSEWFDKNHIQKNHRPMLMISIKEMKALSLKLPEDSKRVLLTDVFYSAENRHAQLKEAHKATQRLSESVLFEALNNPIID
ncbi:MAG: restriction endonuclease subunit S [Gammaproteobacteria bacterium]|nr:restriction endonuclease subunit S [Gammaproteobacteria bacterium]